MKPHSLRTRARAFARRLYLWLMQRRSQMAQPENLASSAIVFSPHQDDETLGCGGTILKKIQAGASVRIVFMTDGSQSHAQAMSASELKDIRMNEALAAAEKLGVARQDVVFLNVPDGTLSQQCNQAIASVKSLLLRTIPEEVFVPYRQDGVADHDATCQVVLSAIQASGLSVMVHEYPVWFWCNWPWTVAEQSKQQSSKLRHRLSVGRAWLKHFRYAVDIEDVLDLKQSALSAHRSQMTKLVPDPSWLTLGDIAEGEFLPCFFQNREFFHRYRLN